MSRSPKVLERGGALKQLYVCFRERVIITKDTFTFIVKKNFLALSVRNEVPITVYDLVKMIVGVCFQTDSIYV
jgi:hypothetical protein